MNKPKQFNLINYDWGDSYEFTGNRDNWNLVDYYVDDVKQSDEEKIKMFQEIESRCIHNIWEITRFEGTSVTHALCDEMEECLQKYGKYNILYGYIKVKED